MFLCVLLALLVSGASSVEVKISQKLGVDNSSCFRSSGSIPCGSIHYALQILSDVNFGKETVFKFSIQDRHYDLQNRIQILQPRRDRRIYITSAKNSFTVISCASESSGITLGSQAETYANSTYNVHVSNIEFQHFTSNSAAVVMIWNSDKISFTNCVFKDNDRSGINAFDSGVTIDRCIFTNNTSNLQKLKNSGSHFTPNSASIAGGAGFVFEYAVGLNLVITNTNFTANSAEVDNDENFIPVASFSPLPVLKLIGGGLLVAFMNTTSSCRAVVQETSFERNEATFGGGLFYGSTQYAKENSMEVRNSRFVKNRASQAGGGVSIGVGGAISEGEFRVTHCVISDNWSRRGGGLNVFLVNCLVTITQSLIQFNNVTFDGNSGLSSAAVRLETALPVGYPINAIPEFIDCTIQHHCATYNTHTSPFTSQSVNAKFTGRNIFMENHGAGAMEYLQGRIHVNGSLEFIRNSGPVGGAVLLSSSQIILYPGSELSFVKNYARVVGGAIVVSTSRKYEFIHEYNPDCFVRYSEDKTKPSKWKTKVSFIQNSANFKGAAVYISTLSACLWYEKYPFYSAHRAVRWNNTFEYRGNFIHPAKNFKPLKGTEYDIATDTNHFQWEGSGEMEIKLSPGEDMPLNIQGYDELNHTIFTVATLIETGVSDSNPKLRIDNIMHLLSPVTNQSFPFMYRLSNKTVYKEIKNNTVHRFWLEDLSSTFKNRYSFNVTAIPCRPGFKFEDTKCSCDKSIDAVLRCGDDTRTVYLKEGYWGEEVDGRLVTYFCPPNYCRCERKGDLPGCIFNSDRIDDQCAHNRTGVLCGKCQKGLSVGLRWEDCLECDGGIWIIAVGVIFVIIVCVVIIILNPSMSSELRGPLFFFQVLPFVFEPNNDVGRTVLFVGDILNFGSPFIYFLHTCIIKGITNLYEVAFGYLMPFVILLVFLISYVLSAYFYLVRFKLRKHSSLQSFWLMTLLVYNKFVVTTFILLHCPKVGGKMVFFYDGNVECFKGEHLGMTFLACAVLFGLVIPLPVIVLVLTKGYWKVDPQYVNTLINGLRPHCRWWWSVDMLRRVLLMAAYSLISPWYTKQLITILMCALILAVHSIFQPYRKTRANVVESLYLNILCVIAIMQVFQDSQSIVIANIVCSVLVIVTTLHAGALFVYKAVGFFKRRFKCSCPKRCPRQRTYGSMAETAIDRSVDPALKARKDIFDTIFSKSEDSEESFDNYNK